MSTRPPFSQQEALDSETPAPSSIARPDDAHETTIGRHDVLIVDPSVADYRTILAGLDPGTEVIVLEPGAILGDIATALDDQTGIDGLHIISHGSARSLQFGGQPLTLADLGDNSAALRAIGNALSADCDILLYGCNTGQGDEGRAFLVKLAALTGADVAASDDLTGAAALGGDWELEISVEALASGKFNSRVVRISTAGVCS